MRPEGVHVVGLGAVTAVGHDSWSSAAAVRARVSGMTEHPYMIDSTGEPVVVALAPWLDIDLPERERFEALLFPAVDQALATLDESADPAIRLALALGLPAARPGVPANLELALRASIAARFEARFSLVAMFDVGHAAGV